MVRAAIIKEQLLLQFQAYQRASNATSKGRERERKSREIAYLCSMDGLVAVFVYFENTFEHFTGKIGLSEKANLLVCT